MSDRIRSSLAACFVLALLMSTACDSVKAPPQGRGDPLLRQNYPNVTVGDELDEWLYIGDITVVPGGNVEPLSVTVPVRLAWDEGREIQYRFFFMDQFGRPLKRDPLWKYTSLPPRTQVFLMGNPMETTAVEWRLEIKAATVK